MWLLVRLSSVSTNYTCTHYATQNIYSVFSAAYFAQLSESVNRNFQSQQKSLIKFDLIASFRMKYYTKKYFYPLLLSLKTLQ